MQLNRQARGAPCETAMNQKRSCAKMRAGAAGATPAAQRRAAGRARAGRAVEVGVGAAVAVAAAAGVVEQG